MNWSLTFVVADKVCESDDLRKIIRRSGAKPVISSGKGSRRRRCDNTLYKLRNEVKRFFCRLKHYWRVARRYDKTDAGYFGFLTLETQLVNYN